MEVFFIMFFKNKHLVRFVTSLISAGILLGAFPLPAAAAGFSHKHTSSCYKEVTKTCSDHEISVGKETVYRQCPQCGVTGACYYETYTDVCKAGRVGSLYVGGTVTCNNCGYVLEKCDPSTRTHKYKEKELSCGMGGKEAATISVGASETGWTNKNVMVSCSVSISDPSFSLASAPYSFNGGGFGGTSSFEVSQNGSYSFTVMDSHGRTASESISVGNIDKEAPQVSLSKSTSEWTEEGLTISASASDALSGLADEAYSFSGGFSSNSSLFVTANGTYSVTVRDRAGNTASASIEISNIGRDPAIVAKEEEEKRRKEEEERKRKEEEERKKKEEEEKRKKEEEEKKRKAAEEEEKKKKQEDDPGKKESGEDKKDQDDDKKSSGGLSSLIGSIIGKKDEVKEEPEDVSENDTSGNDVSGNLIPFTEVKPTKTASDKKTDIKSDIAPEASDMGNSMSLWKRFSSLAASAKMFISGLALVLLAAVIFSSLNFVYTLKEGKVKPVAVARVKKDRKKLFVCIPSKPLEADKDYKVFYSLWSRLLKKDRAVIIDVDGHYPVRAANDGSSFVYNG